MGEIRGSGYPASEETLFSDEDPSEVLAGAEILTRRVVDGGLENLVSSASGEPTKVVSNESKQNDFESVQTES